MRALALVAVTLTLAACSDTLDVASGSSTAEAALTDPCDVGLIHQWQQSRPPATGLSTSIANQHFDQAINDLMASHPEMTDNGTWPGLSVAVEKGGKLVFARSWGFKDRDAGQPLNIDNSFRIGSVSKVITATTMLRLIDQGVFGIDDKFLPILAPALGITTSDPQIDPRLWNVRIRDLLDMTAGVLYDVNVQDPGSGYESDEQCIERWLKGLQPGSGCTFHKTPPSPALGSQHPPSIEDAAQYWLRNAKVTFGRGKVFEYYNFNYELIALLIKHASLYNNYQSAANGLVTIPANTRHMTLGATLPADRPWYEVAYSDVPGASLVPSVYNPSQLVPAPDGGYAIEAFGPDGGWISSPVDLLRFLDVVDERSQPADILTTSDFALRDTDPLAAALPSTGMLPTGTGAHCSASGACSSGHTCVNDVNGNGWCLGVPDPYSWYGLGLGVSPDETPPTCSASDHNVWARFGYGGAVTGSSAVINRLFDDGSFTYMVSAEPSSSTWGADVDDAVRTAYSDTLCDGGFDTTQNLFSSLDNAYSDWFNAADYQNKFDTEANGGRFPARVEGRFSGGIEQYRALFAPAPTGWSWGSVDGWTCSDFKTQLASAKSDGMQLASLQWFLNSNDHRARFQATWVRHN